MVLLILLFVVFQRGRGTPTPTEEEQAKYRQELAADAAKGRIAFYLGDSFHGHRVATYAAPAGMSIVTITYGTRRCRGGGGGAANVDCSGPPVIVTTESDPYMAAADPQGCSRLADQRGVPAIKFGRFLTLVTTKFRVTLIYSGDKKSSDLAKLQTTNGSIKPGEPLPPPTKANLDWVNGQPCK